jgi:pilus assembly protein CpaB
MKSKYILIAAIIMGIITTVLFRQYIVNLDKKYKESQKIISVVVPKADIKKNQMVTKDMLELKDFSAASVHPQAVRKIENIAGQYALVDMKAGEILFASRFTNQFKETEQITRKIKDGYRAVSIGVTDVESVSSLINPENYVDVVSTTGDKNNPQTVTLLTNVRVLAVGKRITEKDTAVKTTDKLVQNDKANGDYTSVTVELKPEDIVKIVNADEKGDIKFVLRSQLAP